MSLAQLQRDLQAHVLNGRNEIESAISSTELVPIATRLAIYCDAYRLRLIEALDSNYPVLAELLGADAFATLGREYIDAHPSQHYSIRWFGHRLAEHLASRKREAWLIDLARWEWATSHAFDAADANLLTNDDLARVAPNEWPTLQFATHPSLSRLQLRSNVVALVKAAVAEQSLPEPCHAETTEWCVWREDLSVRYRSLDAIESLAIDAVMSGHHFGALCEQLATHLPADEVPLRAASYLKQWIGEQWLIRA
jgi:hypothetical protein